MTKKSYLLPTLSEFFSEYLPGTRGLSENSIRAYKQAFRLLLEYIYSEKGIRPEKVEFKHLENGSVEAWLVWLCAKRGCCAKTRNHRLSVIVTFARFAMRKDFSSALSFCSEVEHLPQKRGPKRTQAVYLSREEMAILLRLPNAGTKTEKRDKVILSTLYASGARVQELCDLTVGDIRFGATATMTLHGKGNKTRTIVIPQQCTALLKAYMEQNQLIGFESFEKRHVFSSQTHEHMTISCVESIVKKYIRKAKELRSDLFRENYTPHSFRHSIAMHMLESGIPLPVIKTFLGHASIGTTMIYANANFELVSRYLKDKNPYAQDSLTIPQADVSFVPQWLR